MTVVHAFSGQVKPGRHEEVIELHRHAAKVVERHGATEIRLLGPAVSGAETYSSMTTVMQFPTMEAFGTFLDEALADDEVQRLQKELRAADAPLLAPSATLAVEIPLGRKATKERGRVLQVFVSRLAPGRMTAACELSNRAFDMMEGLGARNCRSWSQMYAGLQTNLLIGTIEWESMRALGRATDTLDTRAEFRSVTELVMSSDSPVTPVSADLYLDIAV